MARTPPPDRDGTPPRDARGAATAPAAAAPGAGMPGDTLRAVATALLTLYLVGLGLCVVTNTSSGTSALLGGIQERLFAPWMVPAWLDLGHDTYLTYGIPEDGDHHVEIVPRGAGARAIRLPEARDRSGGAARWRRLARAWAVAEEEGDEVAGPLAEAIGAASLDLAGTDDVVVRLRRTIVPERAAAAAPTVDTVVSGRARVVGDGAEAELEWIPMPPAEELAPLVARPEGAR
jgi:hypothetical protein